ncbi:MAG: hypothetical protein PVH71_01740 [Chromatiales bacterium]
MHSRWTAPSETLMRISIDSNGNSQTDRIRDLLHFNLSAFEADILRIHISLKEDDDKQGSKLSLCRVVTHLRSRQSIAIEEIQSSENLALRRAIERTGRTLSRRYLSRTLPY